jgi:succinate dehydrogenase hydrophobic membrane anchor protein
MVFRTWHGHKECLPSYIHYINSEYFYDYRFLMDYLLMKASQKWKIERISYLALIPISYWFIIFFLNSYPDENSLHVLLSNTFNKIFLLIFFVVALVHIKIQLAKVYEDYFTISKIKIYSLITNIVIILSLLIFLPALFF